MCIRDSLTDVDGLYENFENKDSLISNLTLFEAQYMVENNICLLYTSCSYSSWAASV